MGKVIARKVCGMNLWAKVALTVLFTFVLSVFMYEGWYKPLELKAATTATKYGGTATQSGSGWSNLTSAQGSTSGTYATYSGTTQSYLRLTNYGFTTTDIPTGSTINGITVNVRGRNSQGSQTMNVALTKNGTTALGSKTFTISSSYADNTQGSTSDLWGQTWAVSDLTASTFGVMLRDSNTTASGTFEIDYITVTITYTAPTAAPTVTSTSPSSRGQGATSQTITINGTNFQSGATVAFSGTGITLNGAATFVSATQLTQNISVATNATIGARDVTVTNPDAQSGTGTGDFTVNAAPTVTTASPNNGTQGATNLTVTINGTGFQSGATVAFSGTGITLNGAATFVSATQLTQSISIASNATSGARDITVTNPDGGTPAIGTGDFTVNAAVVNPTVTSASPNTMTQGTGPTTVTLTGTGFQSGATVTFSGTGITTGSVTVANATTITVPVTVASNATAGARDVTVTNTDTGTGTGTGIFTVNAGAVCTASTPTLSVSPTSSTVSPGSGTLYTVTLINNDSAACSATTFTLSKSDSNPTGNFTITGLSQGSLNLAPGASSTSTFTATASEAAVGGNSTSSTINASAGGHTAPAAVVATTTVGSGLVSPLMHNSDNTSSTYGTWGLNRNCSWCHSATTSNVKRIANQINTPTGIRTVIFTRMTASNNNIQGVFGNDERTYALNGSTNVCEVCHHQTTYHQYSASKIAVKNNPAHANNRKDCTSCHVHGKGFKAGCNTCHGYPPIATTLGGPSGLASPATLALGASPANAGAHAAHDALGMLCATCHNNYSNGVAHPSTSIQIDFAMNNANWPGFTGSAAFGSFSGNAPTGGSSAVASIGGTTIVRTTANNTNNSCNVYCHGNWPGSNGSTNPRWAGGASQANCGTCHGASNAQAPATGSHTVHASSSAGNYGFSCTKCHPRVSSGSDGHVTGSVQWRLSTSSNLIGGSATYRTAASGATGTVAPSASFGDCANIYCHSNGLTSGATYVSNLTWGTASDGNCGTCHGVTAASLPASTAHARHVGQAAGQYTYACAKCHSTVVSATANSTTAPTVTSTTLHVNKAFNVAYDSFNTGATSCQTTYCHSEGTGGTTQTGETRPVDQPAVAPTWASAASCSMCHTGGTTTGPSYADGSPKANSHAGHTASGFTCDVCHYATTTTGTTIADVTKHVNKVYDISANTSKTGSFTYTYNVNGGSCANSYCHGTTSPAWGANTAAPECEKCHGSTSTATSGSFKITNGTTNTAASTIHVSHLASTHNYSSDIACAQCHAVPALSSSAGHVDSALPVEVPMGGSLAAADGVTPAYNSGTDTCTASYCHGTSMADGATPTKVIPTWTATILTGAAADCGKCHGNPPNTGGHSGVAANACNACHGHVNNTAPYFNDVTKHINGVLDGGISNGGQPCYGCHGSYNVMNSSTATYHHVMDNASPDQAPNTGSYPTSTTVLACVSCHTDHNYFNANKAANLRSGIAVAGSTVAASDFSTTAPNGICISCHSTSMTKSTAQKTGGTTTTPAITGAAFTASAHNYGITSSFGASTFTANCSKCHTDEQVKDKQTSTNKFGTHYSAQRSILSALGITTPTETLGADFCFRCHSKTGDTTPGGGPAKSTASRDYFGTQTMTAAAEDTFTTFQKTYEHNVTGYKGLHKDTETRADIAATKHVECSDCHDSHQAKTGNHTPGSGTLAGVLTGAKGVTVTTWAANWTGVTTWGQTTTTALPAATAEWQICLKCHSSANANYASWGGTTAAAWTDLALEINPNNVSRHPIGTALSAGTQLTAAKLSGGWTPGSIMNCSDCHATDSTASKGPHGSSVKWMLTGPNRAWPYIQASMNGTSNTTTTNYYTLDTTTGAQAYNRNAGTTNGLFCLNCHPILNSNTYHSSSATKRTSHRSFNMACVNCHIRVPHGGKIGRLLITTNAPARYKANGNGGYSGTLTITKMPAQGGTISSFSCSSGEHTGGTQSW